MAWTAYQVSFRLLSPMHIGWRKLGNLQQTRPYVTGRSLWGSLTARLTRELGGSNYRDIGEEVDDQLAFTYFYPFALPNGASAWSWPDQWDKFVWPWSDLWDEFAWTFLGSYASTALQNGRNAETGSLHETEFIAPSTREGQQVYLIGYIFKKDTCNLKWKSALCKLQLGGERGYGWGRLHRVDCEAINNGKCFDYDLSCTGDRPKITVPKGKELLAHTKAVGYADVMGTIEPLVGRMTNDTGFGRTLSNAEICWVPGGKVKKNRTFQIIEKGIWEMSL